MKPLCCVSDKMFQIIYFMGVTYTTLTYCNIAIPYPEYIEVCHLPLGMVLFESLKQFFLLLRECPFISNIDVCL